jgi:hypothetical protein
MRRNRVTIAATALLLFSAFAYPSYHGGAFLHAVRRELRDDATAGVAATALSLRISSR